MVDLTAAHLDVFDSIQELISLRGNVYAAKHQVSLTKATLDHVEKDQSLIYDLYYQMRDRETALRAVIVENTINLCNAVHFADLETTTCKYTPIQLLSMEATELQELTTKIIDDLKTGDSSGEQYEKFQEVWESNGQQAAQVASLRQYGSFSLDLSYDGTPLPDMFFRYSNIKIENIHVELSGARCSGPSEQVCLSHGYEVQIKHSAKMTNRDLYSNFHQFMVPTVEAYHFGMRIDGAGATSGQIYDPSRLYYMPSPFTAWYFAVIPKFNPGVDLSGVTGIKVTFFARGKHLLSAKRPGNTTGNLRTTSTER
uniref:Uncharacterized protein n=1 Tax=Mucochytrium quahogii TaxID=96639 RepID=A0A7S2WA22_9STRA